MVSIESLSSINGRVANVSRRLQFEDEEPSAEDKRITDVWRVCIWEELSDEGEADDLSTKLITHRLGEERLSAAVGGSVIDREPEVDIVDSGKVREVEVEEPQHMIDIDEERDEIEGTDHNEVLEFEEDCGNEENRRRMGVSNEVFEGRLADLAQSPQHYNEIDMIFQEELDSRVSNHEEGVVDQPAREVEQRIEPGREEEPPLRAMLATVSEPSTTHLEETEDDDRYQAKRKKKGKLPAVSQGRREELLPQKSLSRKPIHVPFTETENDEDYIEVVLCSD